MKFEKVSNDKIRITLNIEDLKERNIDFHSFMSESIETQELFLHMLDEAERAVGFITKNYKLMIEALAINGGDFILTVTRITKERELEKPHYRKVSFKRKPIELNVNPIIYSFNTFDEFIELCSYLDISNKLANLNKKNSLYLFNNKYYLVIRNFKGTTSNLKSFFSLVNEFGEYVRNSELFERKLIEYGKIVITTNAVNTGVKYFG